MAAIPGKTLNKYSTAVVEGIFAEAGFTLLDEYVNYSGRLDCVCSEGHSQQKTLASIKSEEGCNQCYRNKPAYNRSSTEEFISKAVALNGDRYDYSKVVYIKSADKVVIVCKEHGPFTQTPNKHLMGRQCPECAKVTKGLKRRKTLATFIAELETLYGDIYDYSDTVYDGKEEPTTIKCKIHGTVDTQPSIILRGSGCKFCQMSKGEHKVHTYLNSVGIDFVQEHKFDDCINERPLPFDFYIPSKKVLIEYDGELHYEAHRAVDAERGEVKLKLTQMCDEIKTRYALSNGYKLIRIPYWDFNNIELILQEVL